MVEGGHKLKWWKVERSQEGGRWRQVKMVEGGKKSRRWKRGGGLSFFRRSVQCCRRTDMERCSER